MTTEILSGRHYQQIISLPSPGYGLHPITHQVQEVVHNSGVRNGLCTMFLRHTSASLIIQENADADVLVDLASFMSRLVPENYPYRHCSEGPDDMPAHIRTALTHSSETIPISDGRLTLGTWQGLYLWEHRRGRSTRQLVVHIMGC